MYIHAETDEEAIKEAKRMEHYLKFEADEPKIVSIHEAPYGVIGEQKEVKQ